jgi:hypothetical protein
VLCFLNWCLFKRLFQQHFVYIDFSLLFLHMSILPTQNTVVNGAYFSYLCDLDSFKQKYTSRNVHTNVLRILTSFKLSYPRFILNCPRFWRLSSSPSSLGTTALCEPWPPVLFASTGPNPEVFFSFWRLHSTKLYA